MPEPLIFKFEGNLNAENAAAIKARLKEEVGDRPVVLIDRWTSVVHGDIEGAAQRANDAHSRLWGIANPVPWEQMDEVYREWWREIVRAVYGDA